MTSRSPVPPLRHVPPGRAVRTAGLMLTAAVLLWPVIARPTGLLPGQGVGDLVGWRALLDEGFGFTALVQTAATSQPIGEDILLLQGYPLEALLFSPLLAALPWPLAVNLTVWLLLGLTGLTAAALAGRLTGDGPAALVAGLAWQTTATVRIALEGAAFGVLLGLALLPLILWTGLLALQTHDRRWAALAGGLGGLLLLLRCGGGIWLAGLLVLTTLGLIAARRGLTLVALLPPALVASLLVALPLLAWTEGHPVPGLPLAAIPWALLGLALLTVSQLDPRRPRARMPLGLLGLGLLGSGLLGSGLWSAALTLVELGALLWLAQALIGRPRLAIGSGAVLLVGWGLQWGGLPVTPWMKAAAQPGVVLVVPPEAAGALSVMTGQATHNASRPGVVTGWRMADHLPAGMPTGTSDQWTTAQKLRAGAFGISTVVCVEGDQQVWIPVE